MKRFIFAEKTRCGERYSRLKTHNIIVFSHVFHFSDFAMHSVKDLQVNDLVDMSRVQGRGRDDSFFDSRTADCSCSYVSKDYIAGACVCNEKANFQGCTESP